MHDPILDTQRTLTRYHWRNKMKFILVLCVLGLVVIARLYWMTF